MFANFFAKLRVDNIGIFRYSMLKMFWSSGMIISMLLSIQVVPGREFAASLWITLTLGHTFRSHISTMNRTTAVISTASFVTVLHLCDFRRLLQLFYYGFRYAWFMRPALVFVPKRQVVECTTWVEIQIATWVLYVGLKNDGTLGMQTLKVTLRASEVGSFSTLILGTYWVVIVVFEILISFGSFLTHVRHHWKTLRTKFALLPDRYTTLSGSCARWFRSAKGSTVFLSQLAFLSRLKRCEDGIPLLISMQQGHRPFWWSVFIIVCTEASTFKASSVDKISSACDVVMSASAHSIRQSSTWCRPVGLEMCPSAPFSMKTSILSKAMQCHNWWESQALVLLDLTMWTMYGFHWQPPWQICSLRCACPSLVQCFWIWRCWLL